MSSGSPERDCVFCERLAGRDFWIPVTESEHSVGAIANHQRTPGSLIIVPRRHILTIAELGTEEYLDLWRMTFRLVAAVERAYEPDGMYVWQGGRIPLPHIHARISPRFADRPYTFVPNSELRMTPLSEREEIARRLSAALT
jgi:histidine triad (HIT) family protein